MKDIFSACEESSDLRVRLRHELHDQLMAIALEREQLLLTGFSGEEKENLLGFLRRMHENLPEMNAYDSSAG